MIDRTAYWERRRGRRLSATTLKEEHTRYIRGRLKKGVDRYGLSRRLHKERKALRSLRTYDWLSNPRSRRGLWKPLPWATTTDALSPSPYQGEWVGSLRRCAWMEITKKKHDPRSFERNRGRGATILRRVVGGKKGGMSDLGHPPKGTSDGRPSCPTTRGWKLSG